MSAQNTPFTPIPPELFEMILICRDCLSHCDECDKCNVDGGNDHWRCVACEKNFLCGSSPVCMWCVFKNPYHMITDYVAVGNNRSRYEDFDIVINLDCPNNGTEEGDLKLETRKRPGKKKLLILNCGLQDCEADGYMEYTKSMFETIHKFIEKVFSKDSDRRKDKILFHCRAGICRSASAAIYYLSQSLNISTTDAYQLVKMKRKWVKPNNGFARVLKL